MTIAEFFNKVGFKVNESDVKKVNNTIADIKSTATKLLGAIGIGFSLTQLNALAEEFNGINDKLNYALEYSEDMKDVQKEILASANNCRMAYGSMVDTIVSLKQANSDVFPINEAATFVEYLNKLGKSAGYSDGEISSMQSSIQRVVAAGTMGAADITRIARTTPALIEKICEGLGVTRDELDKMAAAGQITGATLKTAIMNSADSIDSAFDRLDYSISDAMLNIRNKWGYFVDDFNATTGLSQSIAKAMVSGFDKVMGVLNRVRNGVVWLGDKLGGMDKLLRLVAITAGILFAAFNFEKITSGLSNIFKLLGKIKLSTLALIAVAIVIALLVEDFINFMQGNDSVIGSLLEKAGIDTQKVRDTIIGAWNKIKNFLAAAWNAIKDTAKKIWDGLKDFWNKHGESIMAALAAAWEVIKTVLVTAWNVISTVARQVFGALAEWWSKNGEQVMASFKKIWEGIKNLVVTLWNAISAAARIVFGALKKFWDKWGSTIMAYFKVVWDTLVSLIKPFLDAIAGIIDFLANVFTGNWEGAWNAVKNIAAAIWTMIVNLIKGAWEAIKIAWSVVVGWFQGVWNGIVGVFSGVAEWFTGIFTQAWEAIMGVFSGVGEFFQGVWNTIVSLFTSIGTAVGDAISGAVKGAINSVLSGAIGIINGFIGAVNLAISAINIIPGVNIKKLDKLSVPKLAKGGYVEANKPQAVIIGDNRTEGEIVAPEGKLMSIMTQALSNFAAKNAGGEMQAISSILKSIGSYANQNGSDGGKAVSGVLNTLDRFIAKMVPTKETGTKNATTQNHSIVQNVEINNEFNGDTPVQQKASKAMDKSAKDATSEMARALAFSR